MPTVTFLEPGTDATQDLSFFNAANTYVQSVGDSVASAADPDVASRHALKVVCGTVGDYVYTTTNDGVLTQAGSALSMRVRLSTVSPSVATTFLSLTSANDGTNLFTLTLLTTGKLRFGVNVNGGGVVSTDGSTVLSATTWTRITVSYFITSSTVWTAKVYINGVLEITYSNATTLNSAAIALSDIEFGIDTNGVAPSSAAMTIYYKDLYVDNRTDASDPGTTAGLSVTAKRPFANGTTNGFTGTGLPGTPYGTGNARYVNNNYPVGSDTTSYVSVLAAGSAITEEYNVEGLSVGDVNLTGATVLGVQGWLFANSSLTETTDEFIVDGTQSAIASITSTATLFTQNSATPTVYPAGTGTDVGIVTGIAATTTVFGAGVLVAYIPAPTSNLSALIGEGVSGSSVIDQGIMAFIARAKIADVVVAEMVSGQSELAPHETTALTEITCPHCQQCVVLIVEHRLMVKNSLTK